MSIHIEKQTESVIIVRLSRGFRELGNAATILTERYSDREILFIFEALDMPDLPVRDKSEMRLVFILK